MPVVCLIGQVSSRVPDWRHYGFYMKAGYHALEEVRRSNGGAMAQQVFVPPPASRLDSIDLSG
jgi:hypothetical protein